MIAIGIYIMARTYFFWDDVLNELRKVGFTEEQIEKNTSLLGTIFAECIGSALNLAYLYCSLS